MNRITFFLLIGVAAFLAFVEGRGILREGVFGTRIDVLPVLVLYAALRGDIYSTVVVAAVAGLLFDSISANPLGLSLVSLTLVGAAVIQLRGLILRDQALAQMVLGAMVAGGTPVLSLLFLWGFGWSPVVGWGTAVQVIVLGACGAVMAPFFFLLFDWLESELTYVEEPFSRFRSEVEIKRGRG